MMSVDLKIVWAAGFFDGEGSVIMARCKSQDQIDKYYIQFRVVVSQTVLEPLLLLKNLFGGYIYKDQRSKNKLKNHKDCFIWNCCGTEALEFLKKIRPFLIVKNRQADLGIQFPLGSVGHRTSKEDANLRELLRTELLPLNARGRK